MAIYVDNVRIKWRGERWCHLVGDSLEEVHSFAAKLGMRRQWFQTDASYPHYDITVAMRDKALTLGAILGTRRQIITAAKALKAEWEWMQRIKSQSSHHDFPLFHPQHQ